MKFECKWTYRLRQGDLAEGEREKENRRRGGGGWGQGWLNETHIQRLCRN